MTITQAANSIRFLTFEVNGQLYALRADEVQEVIRLPAMARVPQAPPALLGVANLRGSVLPVASLSIMLGAEPKPATSASAIVLDVGNPVAIVVDHVATLESVDPAQIESQAKDAVTSDAHHAGAFAIAGTQRIARILDIRALLSESFARRGTVVPRHRQTASAFRGRQTASAAADVEMLVTFEVAGQEFALPLAAVNEILPAPASVTSVVHAEASILGMTSVRDRLLPLLSLRALLGFSASTQAAEGRQKVVVVNIGNSQVGLVADQARSIVAAPNSQVDPVPPVLAARTGGESRIRSVYRADSGRRLISILAPEQLFRNEIMHRLTQNPQETTVEPRRMSNDAALIYLVFRLADDEFGLPIDTVVEVAQVPAQITRVPRTPKFLEGVANLRGEALPIVDQRRRFDMPALASAEGRRLVIVKTAQHRAGIIVDAVSDVLRTTAAQIEPAPELTDSVSRLVSGILNLEQSRRMVLLLDPAELLTRAEQGLLDAFQASRKKANA